MAERRCFFCKGKIGSPVYLNDGELACMTCTNRRRQGKAGGDQWQS